MLTKDITGHGGFSGGDLWVKNMCYTFANQWYWEVKKKKDPNYQQQLIFYYQL